MATSSTDGSIWELEDFKYLALVVVGTLLFPGLIVGWLLWWPLRRQSRVRWAAIAAVAATVAFLAGVHGRLVLALRDVGLLTIHLIQGLLDSLDIINLPFDISVNFVNPAIGVSVVAVTTACALGIIAPAKFDISAGIDTGTKDASKESLTVVYEPSQAPAERSPAITAPAKARRTTSLIDQGTLFDPDTGEATGPQFG